MHRALIGLVFLGLFGCQEARHESFSDWYRAQELPEHLTIDSSDTLVVYSDEFFVDQIYRSMAGPFDQRTQSLPVVGPLAWLTGYRVDIISTDDERLSDEFMCHNNLNVPASSTFPWPQSQRGSQARLFTLTQSQTDVKLPEGFGIPVVPSIELEFVSQVLNHNYPDTQINVRQRIELHYKAATKGDSIKPLFQKAVFITKQISGPTGRFGSNPNSTNPVMLENSLHLDSSITQCAPPLDTSILNPMRDEFGRKYTGHWKVPPGEQYLETDVTEMIGLTELTTVHYIGVHVHPFCESLALWDLTDNVLLWQADVVNQEDRIGLRSLPVYSSVEGIPLTPMHRYGLKCIYNNTTDSEQTAMATMFLYLDKN